MSQHHGSSPLITPFSIAVSTMCQRDAVLFALPEGGFFLSRHPRTIDESSGTGKGRNLLESISICAFWLSSVVW